MANYLVFRDTLFREITQPDIKESDLAVLEVDGKESTLYFNESIKLVDKLTAQRQVNSIIKTGFLLQNNMRIGIQTNLKVVTGSIPLIKTHDEGPLIIPPIEKESEDDGVELKMHVGFHESVQLDKNHDISNYRKSGSIQDVFREEQKKIMAETQTQPPKNIGKSYEELVEYFWKELFGQVYDSWDSLPQKAKEDFFASLNIKRLSNEEVQELFKLRHENNIEAFKVKLSDFKNKNK